jgi:hypothetical protein
MSQISASVVSSSEAIDDAFWSAERTHLKRGLHALGFFDRDGAAESPP